MEFHFLKTARDKYLFTEDLFLHVGEIARFNYHGARKLVAKIKKERQGTELKEVKLSELFAVGLIHRTLAAILDTYWKKANPNLHQDLTAWLSQRLPAKSAEIALQTFLASFPPLIVYQGKQSAEKYLKDSTNEKPNRYSLLEQILLVYIANENPACSHIVELFDDRALELEISHRDMINVLEEFFKIQPRFGSYSQTIFEILKAPLYVSPNSLEAQLEYLKSQWGELIPTTLIDLILSVEDLIKEEQKPSWLGPGPSLIPSFDPQQLFASESNLYNETYAEPARFSHDTDWMPQVVLIAKNAFVWLDQLSKKYKREIKRLDQIPEEELNQLAQWGFTGLWLIGVWERSPASQKIKQLRGNKEALASAYSIFDFVIAAELGGNSAFENLKARALTKGVRLAGDMVPNHMGIYSKWVMDHPDAFLQLDYPPYPNYSFTGPNLSLDERYNIQIEDGYWSMSDAAVVFRWEDRHTGRVRFIYHGNDGTSFPWNDTAQLDFIKPQVREAVIQLILYLAKLFPILRFDAAMTLTKKHFQRLWYPQAGTGGSIPTRSEYGFSRQEFDQLMPNEFWREVVDRVAEEAPDTLLMAEAFWLTEGFFVRTLGMHRVYNSAFMNMMKMEENDKYRLVIKNILEYDPRILQRFVNFMSNPDEDTAMAQFGKGDKYFGAAAMMVTLPGMPMFGHGQIEGFTEKYGMEFRKAMWEESLDQDLLARHEREIFPLIRKRKLFSGAENFVLYDAYFESGHINEDVFAYSNRSGDERALIVYQNKFDSTKVWIHVSSAISVETENSERKLIQMTLAEGLGLPFIPGSYVIFRDTKSGLEFIRNCDDLVHHGLQVELHAYEYFVFTDFRVAQDLDGRYWKLSQSLGIRGVQSIDETFRELMYEPLLKVFEEYLNPESLRNVIDKDIDLKEFAIKSNKFIADIARYLEISCDTQSITENVTALAENLFGLTKIHKIRKLKRRSEYQKPLDMLLSVVPKERDAKLRFWRIFISWLSVAELGKIKDGENYSGQSAIWFQEWLFHKSLTKIFAKMSESYETAKRNSELTELLIAYRNLPNSFQGFRRYAGVIDLLSNSSTEQFIQAHWWGGKQYFNRESFEELTESLFIAGTLDVLSNITLSKTQKIREIASVYKHFETIETLGIIAEYQLDRLKTLLGYAAGVAIKS